MNQVRTLLLNLRRATTPFVAGEEYVPPDYYPAVLPQELQNVRASLFGENPTRAGLNLLLARLLAYLHACALVGDVFLDDTRITYDPSEPAPDADRESSTHALLSAATSSVPEADGVFRSGVSDAESRWKDCWENSSNPGLLRIAALALALAARTKNVIDGTYVD